MPGELLRLLKQRLLPHRHIFQGAVGLHLHQGKASLFSLGICPPPVAVFAATILKHLVAHDPDAAFDVVPAQHLRAPIGCISLTHKLYYLMPCAKSQAQTSLFFARIR